MKEPSMIPLPFFFQLVPLLLSTRPAKLAQTLHKPQHHQFCDKNKQTNKK